MPQTVCSGAFTSLSRPFWLPLMMVPRLSDMDS
jgi:hypothetical protein